MAPAHILKKPNKRPELWQREFPDPPVKKRLSFGSFGFCRELVMNSELRDSYGLGLNIANVDAIYKITLMWDRSVQLLLCRVVISS